jgi:hypothetical protein
MKISSSKTSALSAMSKISSSTTNFLVVADELHHLRHLE